MHPKEDPPEEGVIPTPSCTTTKNVKHQSSTTSTMPTPPCVVATAPDPPEDFPVFSATKHIPTLSAIATPILSYATTPTTNLAPTTIVAPLQTVTPSANTTTSPVAHNSSPPTPAVPAPPPVVYAKDIKLSFSTYKPATDYSHWKALCLLEAHNNTTYTNITVRDGRKHVLNAEMTDKESAALYLATMKSLGTHAYSIISIDDTEVADGIELWNMLDEHFNEKEESFLLKHDIKEDFNKLCRESNETIDSYRIKFEKKIHLMKINSIALPSRLELIFQFINNMKINKVFDDIIMKMDHDDTFYAGLNWKQLSMKAKKQIKLHQKIHPHHDVFNKRNKRNDFSKDHNPSAPHHIPQKEKPSPSPPKNNPPPTFPRQSFNQDELNKVRAILQNTNNPKYELHQLHLKHPRSCPAHNNAPHPIVNCNMVERVCEGLNLTSTLTHVRSTLNLPAPPPRRNAPTNKTRNLPPAPSSNPAPPPSTPSPPPAPTSYARKVTDNIPEEIPDTDYYDGDNNPFDALGDDDETEVVDNKSNNNFNSYSHSILSTPAICHRTKNFDPNAGLFLPTTNPVALTNIAHTQKRPTPSPPSLIDTKLVRMVIDSGATDHMSPFKHMFEQITYFPTQQQPQVTMGDDKTTLPIAGHGYMSYHLHNKTIRVHGLYIPEMGNTALYSVKQHMRSNGCYFHAEAQQCVLAFPTFICSPKVGNEIEVIVRPTKTSLIHHSFDESTTIKKGIFQPASMDTSSTTHIELMSSTKQEYIPKTEYHKFSETVSITKLLPTATIPTQATRGAIGFDVTSITPTTIQPGTIAIIPTGLATALPPGMYIRIAPRSSLSLKHLSVEGGVIDSDYRGEIRILLKNNGTNPITLDSQQKIAQFIFERAATPHFKVTASLPTTTRNKGGFGSTGQSTTTGTKSFRISPTEVLVLSKNGYHHRFRRVHAPMPSPLIQPEHNQHDNPETVPDPSNKQIHDPATTQNLNYLPPKLSFEQSAPLEIEHHLYDPTETTEVDKVFNMSPNPLSSLPPDQHCTTSTTEPPAPLPVDKPNSSLPKVTTMPQHMLQKSIGHLNTELLQKHMHQLGTKSLQIQRINTMLHTDPGETATMPSKRRNTSTSTKPKNYSDIWHADIGFGPCAAIGGIRYTLMLVDKHSRFKFIYGLKNLTSSLLKAMKQFVIDAGVPPKLIRTDFDHKIIGGKVKDFLLDKGIKTEASPPYRQHQNGLIERHWKTVVAMARNWLTSNLLPSKYWYFAVKRACEVLNVMPIKHDGKITTPYEVVYAKKVDYRILFPLFSIAYIKQMRHEGKHLSKWKSQSMKCIVVGTCSKSNGLLFYHPPSKQLFSCADGYKFDPTTPAGLHFNEKYDGDFFLNVKSDNVHHIHRKPTHEDNATVFIKNKDGHTVKAAVLSAPSDEDEGGGVYTIQHSISGEIEQVLSTELIDHDPSADPSIPTTTTPFPHLPWIKHDARVTLFIPGLMPTPKQGHLCHVNGTWSFSPGRKKKNTPIPLQDFHELAESMVQNKKLFKGWKPHSVVSTARRVRTTSNLIAGLIFNRKVSAKDLHLMQAPTLLKHSKLHPEDKDTWDEAYRQEYQGLVDIDTWETITEAEYVASKHLYKGLMPTMAISIIKYDGNGKPNRAKYRIVALGNLDPHDWSKSDCFAPVLSQLELRFLTAFAAQQRRIPKTADITQAFCQSYLPEGEDYVCRPPVGCPITPPNMYWKLKKTLYGLRRSPRHFYDLATKTLKSVGLQQHPTSPCLFYGTLIEGHPPLYLGLYVDDFIYFSESDAVEDKFQKDFGAKLDTEFNGTIGYFLGINFTHEVFPTGDVSIMLSQEAFIDNLSHMANLDDDKVSEPKTPYRSGYPVDTIPNRPIKDPTERAKVRHQMQTFLGCLNWLSISTRPDIATITNLLAKHTANPSKGHLNHVKYVIRYLKGTKSKGIKFSTTPNAHLESFVKFPIDPSTVTSLCDANWGPQDQSKPRPNESREIDIFKSRSLSGFLLWFGGPVHWVSKRQTVTARSSAEAEIYATDECTKSLLHLSFIIDGFKLLDNLMPSPTTVYNDNAACVNWSKNTTTKGLRHIQIRENAVRESCLNGFIQVKHISGKLNLSDMFTKEDKDVQHFILLRDHIVVDQLSSSSKDTDFISTTTSNINCTTSLPVTYGGCHLGNSQPGQTSLNRQYSPIVSQ